MWLPYVPFLTAEASNLLRHDELLWEVHQELSWGPETLYKCATWGRKTESPAELELAMLQAFVEEETDGGYHVLGTPR